MVADCTHSNSGRWRVVAFLSIVLTTHPVLLQAGERNHREVEDDNVFVRSLASKLKLLDRLVHEEKLVMRISASHNEEARRKLAEAQDLWEQAEIGFDAGNHAAAEDLASQGLAAVSVASRQVADASRRLENDRERYEKLRKRVLSFTEAFQRVVAEKSGHEIASLLDRGRIDRLLQEAGQYAVSGDYEQANERAAEAAEAVETALASARERDTLLHELSFATPLEEYNYERQRNRSYRLLVDMLEREKVDDSAALVQMRIAVKENDRIRESAEELVKRDNVAAAISLLEQGTDRLAHILRMSGLVF